MGTFWTFLTFLVKYGPGIWNALESGADEIRLDLKLLRGFDPAAKKAEETGDQRDLENQFNPGAHPKPKD